MGREWSNPVEARAKGSACNFQLPKLPAFPLPGIPSIKLPQLPRLPPINLYCPFDEEAEEPLE
jgi:hypothetical protein